MTMADAIHELRRMNANDAGHYVPSDASDCRWCGCTLEAAPTHSCDGSIVRAAARAAVQEARAWLHAQPDYLRPRPLPLLLEWE